MSDVGDNASPPSRRRLANPSGSTQAPTQEIARPSETAGAHAYEETGKTLPVPPNGPAMPSDAERATAEKSRQREVKRAARRESARRPRQTRRAKLRLTRVDPWSVTKTSFLLSIAFGIMCVVAVFLVFSVMSAAGLWDKVNETIQQVVNQDPADQFDIKEYVAISRVMGLTMLISVIDVVLITALATLGAFIYNMSAAMLGGVEVTLAEDLD
ncbi:MAG: DUF3566 domain-containing protein [Nocardioidaceae bacterium]